MAEWLCSGLQSRVHRFDSGFSLQCLRRIREWRAVGVSDYGPRTRDREQEIFTARVVELVDTRDLKSLAFIGVPVRFRLRAPFLFRS